MQREGVETEEKKVKNEERGLEESCLESSSWILASETFTVVV